MIMVQALLVAGVPAAEIRCYPLDERSLYTIRLSPNEPTTCVFPAPLKAIVGANVAQSAAEGPGILLSHEAGAEYFSLRLLKDGASGALNVVLRGKVYALAFVPAPEPDRAVVFLDEAIAGTGVQKPTREVLATLIERTKQHGRAPVGGMSQRVESASPGNETVYKAFTATVELVVRYEAEDALVFRVRLESRIDAAVPYDPQALAVRLDRDFFPAAHAEASGSIPSKGTSIVYLVIAGAPGGGRGNLSVQEKFNVIVPHP
jgi:hypothetical protein